MEQGKRDASVENDAVDLDASVGANERAARAADTFFGIGHVGVVVSTVVDFVGLKGESVGGACHHTKIATLAPFFVDSDGSL